MCAGLLSFHANLLLRIATKSVVLKFYNTDVLFESYETSLIFGYSYVNFFELWLETTESYTKGNMSYI